MNRIAPVDDWKKRQKRKNWALLGVLLALIVLMYFIALARLKVTP